jgi:hypothetical protein
MIRSDYILDLIQQMGEFIRHALNLRSQDEKVKARHSLERAARQLTGVGLDTAASLGLDSLLISLQTIEGLDVMRCWMLGTLLAELSELEEEPRAGELLERAKALLLAGCKHAPEPPPIEVLEVLEKICPEPADRTPKINLWLAMLEAPEAQEPDA